MVSLTSKNKLKQKTNQKGAISILGVTIAFIFVLVISGFVSMNKNNWIMEELQSIIDISSINALNNSIDEDKLKKEIFAVKGTNASVDTKQSPMKVTNDTDKVNAVLTKNLKSELQKQIKLNKHIEKINVYKCVGRLEASNWGTNASSTAKIKPQLSLDAILQVTINNNSDYDNLGAYKIAYTDAKTGSSLSVDVAGTTKDGKIVLNVRCLSRVVYR